MEVVLVTAGHDHSVKFWNVLDGTCTITIQHNESHLNRLSISPDKRLLAVAGNPCIRLYDTATGAFTRLLAGHKSNVTACGWQWECRWLWSASEDGCVRIWDLGGADSAGSAARPSPAMWEREFAAKYAINDATLHPDNTEIATADERGCVRVWRLAGRECVFEAVPQPISSRLPVALLSIGYSPDGRMIAAANAEGMVYVYVRGGDDRGDASYVLLAQFQAHDTYITRVMFSPDGQTLCTCSSDCTIKLFAVPGSGDTPSAPTVFVLSRTLRGHTKWVWDCAFSADSAYLISASSDGTARLYERATGDVINVFNGHSKAITCISLNDVP